MINEILEKYFEVMDKNSFLVVESFFKFSDYEQKQQILTDYEEMEEFNPTLDIKDADIIPGEGIIIETRDKVWSEKEDMLLITHFADFRELPEQEYHLCELFKQMNFYDKIPGDVVPRLTVVILLRF